jgi:hypothetical protein
MLKTPSHAPVTGTLNGGNMKTHPDVDHPLLAASF